MKHRHSWKILCSHTPETIDRILLPIRKRGIKVLSFRYDQIDHAQASCIINFETEQETEDRIFKNMERIYDIQKVEIIKQ